MEPLTDLIDKSEASVHGATLEVRFPIAQMILLLASIVCMAAITIGSVWVNTHDLSLNVATLSKNVETQNVILSGLAERVAAHETELRVLKDRGERATR